MLTSCATYALGHGKWETMRGRNCSSHIRFPLVSLLPACLRRRLRWSSCSSKRSFGRPITDCDSAHQMGFEVDTASSSSRSGSPSGNSFVEEKGTEELVATSPSAMLLPGKGAGTSAALAAPGPSRHMTLLAHINESTKWVVSLMVLVVLVYLHDVYAAWCVLGAVLSSFLCKVLKHMINQQRPEYARKADPGMPSSHANSLSYLATYTAISLTTAYPGQLWSGSLAGCSLVLGMFLTWLRVALGYHTWAQVVVGYTLGTATAVAWFVWGLCSAISRIQGSSMMVGALYSLTIMGMVAFAVRNVLVWYEERRLYHAKGHMGLGMAS